MKLAKRTECTGCQACAASCPKACIQMERDVEGFLFPVVAESLCVNCGLCEAACPVLNRHENGAEKTLAYAAYSLNGQLRSESSSGGVFSELAEDILAQGGAVYGAAYDGEFRIAHTCVEHKEDLGILRGAKYAQSDLGATLSDVKARLERKQLVLFSGTPCQVAGLKAFLRKEYENLICVDFVCHGVPSPLAWQQYVKYQARVDGYSDNPVSVNMREKSSGWSRYSYSHRFEYPDGTMTSVSSGDSLFMKLFVGDYLSRGSCGNCHFKGYQRVSDITLGDFWGVWDIAPEMDDNRGTSIVLCHSERGADLIARISGCLVIKTVAVEDASRQNPSILKSSPANPRRKEALEAANRGDFTVLQSWFRPQQLTILQKLRRKIRKWNHQELKE